MYEELKKEVKFIKSEISALKRVAIECEKKSKKLEKVLEELYGFYAEQSGKRPNGSVSRQANGCA